MTPREFNEALEALKIDSHMAAAAILGVGRNTIIRYAHGHTEVPESIRRLIVLLLKHGIPKIEDFGYPKEHTVRAIRKERA